MLKPWQSLTSKSSTNCHISFRRVVDVTHETTDKAPTIPLQTLPTHQHISATRNKKRKLHALEETEGVEDFRRVRILHKMVEPIAAAFQYTEKSNPSTSQRDLELEDSEALGDGDEVIRKSEEKRAITSTNGQPKIRKHRLSDTPTQDTQRRSARQKQGLEARSNQDRRETRSATYPRSSSNDRSVSPEPISRREHRRVLEQRKFPQSISMNGYTATPDPPPALFAGMSNGVQNQNQNQVQNVAAQNPLASLLPQAQVPAIPQVALLGQDAQQQFQLIQLMAAQGIPPDQWGTALQLLAVADSDTRANASSARRTAGYTH
jgi:hypothetical protein